MTTLKDNILNEVKRIIEEETVEGIQINAINEQNNYTSFEQIDAFIRDEVSKAITFYMSKNKINAEQSSELIELVVEKLHSEYVFTANKIKHFVKDIIIHILSRDLKLMNEKYNLLQ